ncbi:hypothetical protein HIM_05724 [Hirsutella minnesotensis 3608]|uniref:Uncharacterized protein n=1 Tax=Hirsutella minnesotensis 3608 TaxID=1043627 RepID=A0A0F7ZP36_9HYPO|nr:hypothetical protein HIM_05724 [Hirsutella minnesotensis 3608]
MCRYIDVLWTTCLHIERLIQPTICEDQDCNKHESVIDLRIGWCPFCEETLKAQFPSDEVSSLYTIRRFWLAVSRDEGYDLSQCVNANVINRTPKLDVVGGLTPTVKQADGEWKNKLKLKLQKSLEIDQVHFKQTPKDGFTLLGKKWPINKDKCDREITRIAKEAHAEAIKVPTDDKNPVGLRRTSRPHVPSRRKSEALGL